MTEEDEAMMRFACQRVMLQIEKPSLRASLSLFDASWWGATEESIKLGPYLIWGRPTSEDYQAGIIATDKPPYLFISEKGEYQLVAKVESDSPISFWEELAQAGLCKDDPSSLLDPSSRSSRLQLHGIVGLLRVSLKKNNRTIASMPLRVMPHKLDYETDLRLLLQELSAVAASLLLRAKRVATLPSQSETAPPTPLERLLILQAILRPSWVPRALFTISQNPHHEIEVKTQLLPRHQLYQALPEQLIQTIAREGSFDKARKIFPKQLHAQRRQLTFDTPENRFTLSVWSRIQREGRVLRATFSRSPEVASHSEKIAQQVAALPPPFPTDLVSKDPAKISSLMLRRRRGYRELWMASRLLGKEVSAIDGASIEAPSRTLPVLYETWCLLVLARCLASLAGAQPKTPYPLFLQLDGVLRFKTGVMQQIAPGVSLGYQMQFQTLRASSLQLRPDFLIELCGRRLVFDAKYRLAEDALSPQHEDLMVAHAYKDALQVDASFVLYPGKGDAIVHRQAPPSILPSVGAFPLRPANEEQRGAHGEEILRQFLQECTAHQSLMRKAAEERAPYGERAGNRTGTVALDTVAAAQPVGDSRNSATVTAPVGVDTVAAAQPVGDSRNSATVERGTGNGAEDL